MARPACVTSNRVPAIVAEPDREVVAVFSLQDTVTAPEPLPDAGDTVSQESLPMAVQLPPLQFAGVAVTVTLCDPANALGLADIGVIDSVHSGGDAPAWVTEKLFPAIVAMADRAVVLGF